MPVILTGIMYPARVFLKNGSSSFNIRFFTPSVVLDGNVSSKQVVGSVHLSPGSSNTERKIREFGRAIPQRNSALQVRKPEVMNFCPFFSAAVLASLPFISLIRFRYGAGLALLLRAFRL